jgi:hypothetical protein
LLLGDTEDRNDVSGQWFNEWPLDTLVDSLIVRWVRDTSLPKLRTEPAEYPISGEKEASNQALLHESDTNKCFLPRAPPPQNMLLFCPLPGQVRHLKWWLPKLFADYLHIFYMYADMGNDENKEM